MKQHTSAKKPSRRSFAKSIACALAAAPFVSEHGPSPQPGAEATEPARHFDTSPTILSTMVFKDHIPPIEISSDSVFGETLGAGIESGSVFLHTQGRLSGGSSMKQVFERNKQIIGVRVIMTDGSIEADYPKGHPDVRGGQIKIWVKDPNTSPDMVLSTPHPGEKLQVEFVKGGHKFKPCNCRCLSHGRQRLTYDVSNTGLLKVVVVKTGGDLSHEHVVTTDLNKEKEIDRIIIWTELA
jgi:hypothetical protein